MPSFEESPDPVETGRVNEVRSARTRVQWSEWNDWRFPPVAVVLSAIVVATAATAVWSGVVLRPFAGPGFTPALPAAVILATFVGWNQLGFARVDLRAWRETLIVIGGLLVAVGLVFVARVGSPAEVLAFGIGSIEEELVFRLALPLAVGGLTAWTLGRPVGDLRAWGNAPCAVAVVAGAVVFTVMPGHLAQAAGPLQLVPFLSIAMLLTYIVLRTGALLPGIAVHALLNLATVAFLEGAFPKSVWVVVVVVGLGAYALGAERAGRRLGLLTPVSG